MTARIAGPIASLGLVVGLSGCTTFYDIPIETPLQPKLDVSAFTRVFIAGFISGGNDDVDANVETVRLLRSQLRSRSNLRLVEADFLPLAQIALDRGLNGNGGAAEQDLLEQIRDERDLEAYEPIFADVDFWRRIGEEYQNPLIVTGTVLFTPHQRSGFVTREQEVYDSFGRRRVVPVRTYSERRGFVLRPKFIFIDGRTGTSLHSESFREEVLYSAQQNTPALSSYFELMDRLIPSFLSTLSTQTIRSTRVLLK